MKPILVIGAGPVGLTTALALHFYGLPFQLFEEDANLSVDTKAGTVLTRTLEAFRRYGVADRVLAKALRVDEIGDVDRATNTARPSVRTDLLTDDTRYPFVINMPQHHLEPILHQAIEERCPGAVRLGHRLTGFRVRDDERDSDLCDAGRRPRIRRELSARLRWRPQHRALCPGHRRRRRVAGRPAVPRRRQSRSRCAKSTRLSVSRLFFRSAGMDDPGAASALLALSLSAGAGDRRAHQRGAQGKGSALHRPGQRPRSSQHPDLPHPSSRGRRNGAAVPSSSWATRHT